ncbi:MAG: hypothetical protein ACRCZF_23840, partial [Gemmataceae bacterium]
MARIRILAAVVGSAIVGCTSINHHACRPSEYVCQPIEADARQRNLVYCYILNGADPLAGNGLKDVLPRLNEVGFERIYYGELYHGRNLETHLRCVHAAEPHASFVLVGGHLAAGVVDELAFK